MSDMRELEPSSQLWLYRSSGRIVERYKLDGTDLVV